ncbi:MAG TPA: histidine kinase [Desulfovibrio sp.]|nr:histidine kinase [Desulfovibrio sp.]
MKKHKILFVDDEVNILKSFKILLRKEYDIDLAASAAEGLEKISKCSNYAVITSDLKMPSMDGIEFLHRVKDIAPDSVRIMLTGHGDLEAASLAVNRGHIFRFLTKPVPGDELRRVLKAAVRQSQLVTAEKELLRGTLKGCIKLLTDVLNITSPEAFSRSERVRRICLKTAEQYGLQNTLQLDLAAMLSQLGCISLSYETMSKVHHGQTLSEEEFSCYHNHPATGAALISNIPRMEEVAKIIKQQNMPLSELPNAPLESRILKVCLDFDDLAGKALGQDKALQELKKRSGWYDEEVLKALNAALAINDQFDSKILPLSDLRPGMIMDQDIRTPEGTLLISKGHEVSETATLRIPRMFKHSEPQPQVSVLIPKEK